MKTRQRWDRKLDRIVCGNPRTNWECTVWQCCMAVPCHGSTIMWYTRSGNSSPPPTSSQTTDNSVLCHSSTSSRLAFALLVCKWCRVAQQHVMHRTLHCLAAPNCMQWGHAVQCATRILSVLARQWRSGGCLKRIYGMAIAFQAPICFGSGTASISESNEIAS